jgi:glycosyltransferase involved in cell wall biosynthesis
VKIGVIYCGYGTKDLVARSLEPWVNLRAQYMGQFDRRAAIHICAVSVRFAGFEGEDDGTCNVLREYKARGDIDHLVDGPQNVPETTARGMALTYLRDTAKADIVIQWDSDEVATEEELGRMIRFAEENPFVAWFRVAYRNLVFAPNQWLAEPFTPPRIHRISMDGYRLHSFSGDNDICYGGTITRDILPQDRFPSLTIPGTIANPAHHTWLSDTPENKVRSQAKVRYQMARWNHCSFALDSEGNLIFNPALPAPRVVREA